MFKSAEHATRAAILSMLLEVSANPKSGNVDRMHDFKDKDNGNGKGKDIDKDSEMRYEHFLLSAVSSYETFLKASKSVEGDEEEGIGRLILESVENSVNATGTNVHFGTFLLLIPLLTSWRGNAFEIAENALNKLKKSDFEDSIAVLKAFRLSNARVIRVEVDKPFLDLESDRTYQELKERKINLYDWMLESPPENLISKELTEGYKISLHGMKLLLGYFDEKKDINTAIVYTYHHLLSVHLDPLLISKFGVQVANEVKSKAKEVLKTGEFHRLDEEFINRKINPGTIADLTASSIFLSLAEGLKF